MHLKNTLLRKYLLPCLPGILLATCLIDPIATGKAQAAWKPLCQTVRVTAPFAWLKAAPSLDSRTLAVAKKGEVLERVGMHYLHGWWLYQRSNGRRYWVHQSVLGCAEDGAEAKTHESNVCQTGPGNLVANGGFEYPPVNYGWELLKELPCWRIDLNGLTEIDARDTWQPAEGHQSIDLNPNEQSEISQKLHTRPNQAYLLSFSMGGNVHGGGDDRTMQVFWNGHDLGRFVFLMADATPENMHWKKFQIKIPAAWTPGAEARLSFRSLMEGSVGPALDDVRVSPLQAD